MLTQGSLMSVSPHPFLRLREQKKKFNDFKIPFTYSQYVSFLLHEAEAFPIFIDYQGLLLLVNYLFIKRKRFQLYPGVSPHHRWSYFLFITPVVLPSTGRNPLQFSVRLPYQYAFFHFALTQCHYLHILSRFFPWLYQSAVHSIKYYGSLWD